MPPPLLAALLALAASGAPASAQPLVRLHSDSVIWGEPVTLEVAAESPLAVARQGGITVSFSAPVLVLEASAETAIYYPGDAVFAAGHRRTLRAREVMAESWYTPWPPGAARVLRLRFVPLATGVLRLRARAAIIRSLATREVLNQPAFSACSDQQGYPAHCVHLFVEPAAPVLERMRAELAAAVAADPTTLRRLHAALAAAADPSSRPPGGTRALLGADLGAAFQAFAERLADPEIRDSPELGDHLRRLLADPLDREALRFFKLLHQTPLADPADRRLAAARSYLAALRGGGNLLSLIAAEADIALGDSTDPQSIVLEHQGRPTRFAKGPAIVRDIVEWIIAVKPHSPYVERKEAISGTSYRDLLQALGPAP